MANKPALRATSGVLGYPDQETRKIVTAGILLARGLAARTEPDVDEAETRLLLEFKDASHGAVRLGRTLGEGHTLCDHLRAVEAKLRSLVDEEFPTAKTRRVIEAFSEEVAAICDPSPGPAGSKGKAWSEQPWACLEELFRFALDTAASDYAGLPGGGLSVGVEAGFLIRGMGFATDAAAMTRFPATDCAGQRSAQVLVDLPRETFSSDQYFALLAKIHHEIFVHAVQALDLPGRRQPYGPCCPLAEGLMDRAAHVALRAAIERDGLPGRAGPVHHRFLSRGDEQHAARMSAAGRNAPLSDRLAAEARINGRDLFEALAQVRGSGPLAIDWAIRLSMRLNLHALGRDERRAMLIHVHGGLCGSKADRNRIVETLSDIVDGADASLILSRA